MNTNRPICSLSLDLDNLWSYMKTHGDPGWESFPSYLDLVVPRVLDILKRLDWTITFFIVGQDAELEKNHGALASIAAAGHEIGNHSFHHEPWLHLYTQEQIDEEISRAEQAIESATSATPQGFRGPGYSLSQITLATLARRGYQYDASTFPTVLGPLARAYYFMNSDLTSEEKKQRKILFGSWKEGMRPIHPYFWSFDDTDLLEIPVTTMPLLKIPFHFSYLLYIATKSQRLALLYFRGVLGLCRAAGVEPSLLLHPLDFLGGEECPELAFFPGMNLSWAEKSRMMSRFFEVMHQNRHVLSLDQHAGSILETSKPRLRRT